MQEQNILETLLLRLDSANENWQVVTVRETKTWPAYMLDVLCHEGLLIPTTPSNLYTCTNCNDEHDEEVMVIESPSGSAPRMYIDCPSVGRVRVDPEELRQWRLVPEGFVNLTGRLMGIPGPYREVFPSRAWWISITNLGGADREIFMFRGLRWSDGSYLRDRALKGTNTDSLALITPYYLPDDASLCVIPLTRLLRLLGRDFTIDRASLDLITAGWKKAPSPRQVRTRDDFQYSEDYRTVVLRGVTYTFTTRQAQVIEVLIEALENGMPELSQEKILDRIGTESDSLTLRDIFRNSKAWNNLIVSGSRRGMYRLNI